MKVTIVIVTYNGEKWLKKCLQSVFNQTVSVSVCIVDNGSEDGTLKIINDHDDVVNLQQNTNLGFGAANNIGISHALNHGADYVFLLNQDAYLDKNVIERLVEISRKHVSYGILSPIHLNGNGSALDVPFSNYMAENSTLISNHSSETYVKDVYDVPFVNAAGWLISRQTLEIVGGFDPIFYHYGEDNNYCQRILYHDFRIGIVPKIYLRHDREHRKVKPILSPEEKLKTTERVCKIKCADINQSKDILLKSYKKKFRKAIIILSLQFKFKKVRHRRKELELVKSIEPQILESKRINKTKGFHYLEIRERHD